MVNIEELESMGRSIRETEFPNPLGKCFPASKALKEKLEQETGVTNSQISVREVRMGDAATIRHYK